MPQPVPRSVSADVGSPCTPVFDAVAKRWAEHRDAGRLATVSALCKAAGISRTTWYALGDPNRRPVRETLIALAEVLDMDAEDLMRRAGYGRSPAPSPPPARPSPAHPGR